MGLTATCVTPYLLLQNLGETFALKHLQHTYKTLEKHQKNLKTTCVAIANIQMEPIATYVRNTFETLAYIYATFRFTFAT
jgi:hypothetical protein